MKWNWLNILGHLGYILMLLGNLMIANMIIWGWLVHFIGDLIWIGIGIKLRMSSIWFWQPVFLLSSLYGFVEWME